jgi:SAM-dependent methyltransferase
MLQLAKVKRISNARFIHGDGHNFTLLEKFDAVVFITTLEFIRDPIIAIKNAIQHIKPCGILLFGVLNANSWLGLVKDEDPVYNKAKFYSEQSLLELFQNSRKITLTQCVFSPPSEILEKSEEEILAIDLKAQENNKKSGAFIAGRVQL